MDFRAFFICLFMNVLGAKIIDAIRLDNPKPRYAPIQGTKFNVVKFGGAVGDGITDDSKAFQLAWNAACRGGLGAKTNVTIPFGKTYLIFPTVFKGPCKTRSITVEIFGKLLAPKRSQWVDKGADEWLKFEGVNGLRLVGNGQGEIDGQGKSWWHNGVDSSHRPTALRLSRCNNLQMSGLKHTNSPMNHISITDCHRSNISKLHINAPPKSPNTDGIDISGSTNLHIYDSIMKTGDDCIAINGGTSNVKIWKINCGPGHGISIGSLGRHGKRDEVQNIHVTNCTFDGSDNGVRIKTWQGGLGFARNISFSDINFIKVNNTVIIDQYYCPHKSCRNKERAVQISDVRYSGLRGTSTSKNTIKIDCSKTVPCKDIILEDIDIKSANGRNRVSAECVNAHGIALDHVDPVVNCLKRVKTAKARSGHRHFTESKLLGEKQ